MNQYEFSLVAYNHDAICREILKEQGWKCYGGIWQRPSRANYPQSRVLEREDLMAALLQYLDEHGDKDDLGRVGDGEGPLIQRLLSVAGRVMMRFPSEQQRNQEVLDCAGDVAGMELINFRTAPLHKHHVRFQDQFELHPPKSRDNHSRIIVGETVGRDTVWLAYVAVKNLHVITHIETNEAYRRKGFATRIIGECPAAVVAEVPVQSESGLAFFRALGWIEGDERKGVVVFSRPAGDEQDFAMRNRVEVKMRKGIEMAQSEAAFLEAHPEIERPNEMEPVGDMPIPFPGKAGIPDSEESWEEMARIQERTKTEPSSWSALLEPEQKKALEEYEGNEGGLKSGNDGPDLISSGEPGFCDPEP